MKSGQFPWQLAIIVIGLGIVFFIYSSDRISNDAILPALGGLCLILGLVSLRTGWAKEKHIPRLAVLQCAMGVLILGLGIVEVTYVELPEGVWYALLVLILALLLVFGYFRYRKK